MRCASGQLVNMFFVQVFQRNCPALALEEEGSGAQGGMGKEGAGLRCQGSCLLPRPGLETSTTGAPKPKETGPVGPLRINCPGKKGAQRSLSNILWKKVERSDSVTQVRV